MARADKKDWLGEFTEQELTTSKDDIVRALEMTLFSRTQERKSINKEIRSLRATIKQLRSE